MDKIKTPIDVLFNFIESNSPVKECDIPKKIKKLGPYENYLDLLELNKMIEVKASFLSKDRVFIFKSNIPMADFGFRTKPIVIL